MDTDILLALLAFALTATITPGPNNIMIMASGANFGIRRSVPHAAGITVGFWVMIVLVGLGLGRAFEAWPALRTVLAVCAALYLGRLAWKVARAAAPGSGAEAGRPLTFLQAAGFQWVNPKGWAMSVTAITLYAHGAAGAVVVASAFGVLTVVSVGTWLVAGTQVRRLLTSPGRLRVFNWTMAALLLASLGPALVALLAR